MSDYRRRRFLTDLMFVGGGLLAAAGLAAVGQAEVGPEVKPVASASVSPAPSGAPASPVPVCSKTPQSTPQLPTAGKPAPPPRVLGGAVAPPNSWRPNR